MLAMTHDVRWALTDLLGSSFRCFLAELWYILGSYGGHLGSQSRWSSLLVNEVLFVHVVSMMVVELYLGDCNLL